MWMQSRTVYQYMISRSMTATVDEAVGSVRPIEAGPSAPTTWSVPVVTEAAAGAFRGRPTSTIYMPTLGCGTWAGSWRAALPAGRCCDISGLEQRVSVLEDRADGAIGAADVLNDIEAALAAEAGATTRRGKAALDTLADDVRRAVHTLDAALVVSDVRGGAAAHGSLAAAMRAAQDCMACTDAVADILDSHARLARALAAADGEDPAAAARDLDSLEAAVSAFAEERFSARASIRQMLQQISIN
jgi:hypothetical protein